MDSPRLRWVALVAAMGVAAVAPTANAARPNLIVTKVSKPPKTAVPGGKFRVRDTVKNKGGKRARKTATRFYLSLDKKRGLGDLLMGGAREVPKLKPGKASAAPKKPAVKPMVDVGTPQGEYFLLACADDREAVRESKEGDNCRRARRKVRVTVSVMVAESLRFDTISDTTPEIDPVSDEQQLVTEKGFRCAPKPKQRVPNAQEAVASIKASIEGQVGKADYAAFKRSREYRSALGAEDAAAAAFLAGQPGAALAAMVRAHELEPKEASHLVNAAGLASTVGMPHEALALYDKAETLDDRDLPAMGISRQAVALAGRAHALASIGEYGKAVQAADAALAIEPLLSEAERTAGMAELCAGKTPVAVARIRKGRKRQPGKEPPLDDSKGQETELRNLPLPSTPEQAVAINDFYAEQSQAQLGEIQSRNERETQLQLRLNAKQGEPSYNLNQKLIHAVRMASGEPRFAAMQGQLADLQDKAHLWWQEKWCEGTTCEDEEYGRILTSCNYEDGCVQAKCIPATRGWHQGWLNDQAAYLEAAKAYTRAVTKRMSALAAHIGDPDAYALAMLAIEQEEFNVWIGVHQAAWYWTDWTTRAKHHCVEGFQPPPATDGTDPAGAAGSGPCPNGLKSFNFVLELKVLSLKANCSEVQIGASTPGWIGGFGEVTHDFRTGKTTLFAGAQAGVKAGPLKADFKSGIYVTSSSQGFEDIGMRAGPSTSVGAGPVEFSGPSDSVDISFVPVFASN